MEKAKTDMGVKFLNLDWIDTTSFNITDESLSDCCKFIYRARMAGSSVLVHCAQVYIALSIPFLVTPTPSLLSKDYVFSAG